MDRQIAELCEEAIASRVFPGCQVGYIHGGEAKVLPFGRQTYEASSPAVTRETIYDVASITKSIPTNSIILKLIEEGRLSLDDRAITYLPEIRNNFREQILIRHLLTYTVVLALPTGMSVIAKETPDRLMDILLSTPLKAAPGGAYFYTNPPAILLGMIAERICGQPLDVVADEMFFRPLKMTKTTFHGEQLPPNEVAPTAEDFRGLVQGQPHDETAWALRNQGLVAGNAALYTTSGDLLKFTRMLLDGGESSGRRFFTSETITLMHTNQIAELGARVGLGWELDLGPLPARVAEHQVFGKTGFTGCAMLIDPADKRALVYLSNRSFPQRPESREPIQAFRRKLAALVFGE